MYATNRVGFLEFHPSRDGEPSRMPQTLGTDLYLNLSQESNTTRMERSDCAHKSSASVFAAYQLRSPAAALFWNTMDYRTFPPLFVPGTEVT